MVLRPTNDYYRHWSVAKTECLDVVDRAFAVGYLLHDADDDGNDDGGDDSDGGDAPSPGPTDDGDVPANSAGDDGFADFDDDDQDDDGNNGAYMPRAAPRIRRSLAIPRDLIWKTSPPTWRWVLRVAW